MYREVGDAECDAVAQGADRESQDSISEPAKDVIGIDLFAGAGGFSLAALSTGIDIICAIENEKHAAATYSANLSRPDGSRILLLEKDILSVSPEDVLTACALAPGRCDIILGGPPCQGFSTHRLNGAGVQDPRNVLLARYFDFVAAIRPRAFVMENVPGLLWDRHKDYLEQFITTADANEYDLIGPLVLNARDYGVPQNRKRVFLLGLDRRRPLSIQWPPPPTHCSPSTPQAERQGRLPWKSASIAFSAASDEDPNDIHMHSGEALIAVFKKTPPNGGSRRDSGRVLPCHRAHDGHKDVYGRIDPLKPAPTMTTACINPSKGRFVHPTEHHGITLRQAARLQSFPDDFIFKGGLMAGGKQVGNAVPVDLGKALLKPLYQALVAAQPEATDGSYDG